MLIEDEEDRPDFIKLSLILNKNMLESGIFSQTK